MTNNIEELNSYNDQLIKEIRIKNIREYIMQVAMRFEYEKLGEQEMIPITVTSHFRNSDRELTLKNMIAEGEKLFKG